MKLCPEIFPENQLKFIKLNTLRISNLIERLPKCNWRTIGLGFKQFAE